MPIVGPVPDVTWFETEYGDLKHGRPAQNYASASYLQGLYISAAHGSRGMTSCFLAAEIVAAQIEMTPLPVDQSVIEAINPARFIIRRLKPGA
jgi:tRNA 5-methylaminomethyl-2-thiouridine biosynthesis bifunctional protein